MPAEPAPGPEAATPPMAPGTVTAGDIAAAQRHDYDNRAKGYGWTQVSHHQLIRLLAPMAAERDALAAERDQLIVQLDATRRELADSEATRREYARQLREAKRELEAARDRLSPPDTAADPMEAPDAG